MSHAAQSFAAPASVGVDVSKAELVVAERHEDRIHQRTLANTAEAAEALACELVARGFRGKLLAEATGAYHWPLVLAAAEQGLDVRLINPLQSAKHRQGRVRKCKTDRVDAAVLADMALTERELPPPFRLDRAGLRLRQHLSLIASLEHTLQALQGTLRGHREAAAFAGVAPVAPLTELEAAVKRLKGEHRRLQREADRLARQLDERGSRQRWSALPGITEELGALLGAVLDGRGRSVKSWVAFAGLDVSVRESGTFVGRGKLSKRGSPYLRKRLYQAAWGAAMNHPQARAYYDMLKARGRAHREALIIIARKLVRAGFALAQNPDREVDVDRLFRLPA